MLVKELKRANKLNQTVIPKFTDIMSFTPGWYLIYTKPKHEKKIVRDLEDNEIKLFLPQTRVMTNRNSRKKILEVPLFPSYVFVSINKIEDYYKSLQCNGALNYVRFGKEIARIKDETVENLMLLMQRGHKIEVSSERFTPGHVHKIQKGVFAGLECEIVEHKNEQKVLVRVSLLNRNVLAHISNDIIAN